MNWVNKVSGGEKAVDEKLPKNAGSAQKQPDMDKRSARRQKRLAAAVDFAYTLNHAIVCTATDPITDIPIGVAVQKILDKNAGGTEKMSLKDFNIKNIGGGLKETFTDKTALIQWAAGELGGDFGAVPAVVALRHLAPGVVNGIRSALSPIATPIFKRSSDRAAKKEFAAQGMDVNSPECQARAKEIFDMEMEHLPNAALWTVLSPAINITVQKGLLPKSLRNDSPTSHLVAGKAIGSTVTSSLTVGLRNLNPKAAQKWDDTVTEKVAMPVLNVVSRLFGVDKDELEAGVKEMHERNAGRTQHPLAAGKSGWEKRLAQESSVKTSTASPSL